jgi:RNA polymerase sigma-54 factor
MRLEHTPRQEQTVHVSARLITASTLLHLSSDELERAIEQEQMENPALEVREQRICLFCGTPLYSLTCSTCGKSAYFTQSPMGHDAFPSYDGSAEGAEAAWASASPTHQPIFYDIDNYGFAEADSDNDADPMALLATDETLVETLLQQLEALVTPADVPIAEQLVGNLNERGYLEISTQEIADQLAVPLERVEYVLHQLQTLEPPGIGARDLRECLLIQLHALSEQATPPPLVYLLIDQHLNRLGHNQFHDLARILKQPEQEIRQACLYIRTMLHPFPAHTYRNGTYVTHTRSGAIYVRPDVIIRKSEASFEVELIEERRYSFQTHNAYSTATHASEATPPKRSRDELQHYMHHYSDRANFFVTCIHRRWQTLRRVSELVVAHQRAFLSKGVRYLRPLTRAEVAASLGLDEGTVSRATANKYALLPNGRLLPFSDFFDSSLSIKDSIRELLQSESPRHRLSDDDLARLLTERGIPIARRTVTKYREEMGIGSSRERS